MLAAIIASSYVLGYVITGRASYAIGRNEAIKEYGLKEYEKRHDAEERTWAHVAALIFPLTWAIALVLGVGALANIAVTGKPYRGPAEREELLKLREEDIHRRELDLEMH